MLSDPNNIKNFLYICSGVIGLAGTFFGIGKYFGKKNHETEEILKMWQAIEKNEAKAKSRLYTPDGSQIFMRAGFCEKIHTAMRADILKVDSRVNDVEKKQATYESTLESIDKNVLMLVELFKNITKQN